MINATKQAAKRSKHIKSQHGAVLMKGGRVLAFAWNKGKVHAEIGVMRQVTPKQCKKSIIWTVRVKDDKLMMGRPCLECLQEMSTAGVKMVWYSLPNGEMDWMYVSSNPELSPWVPEDHVFTL